jgi:hypothetical protein
MSRLLSYSRHGILYIVVIVPETAVKTKNIRPPIYEIEVTSNV